MPITFQHPSAHLARPPYLHGLAGGPAIRTEGGASPTGHGREAIPFKRAPLRANHPADSQTKRATNSAESTSSSQSVLVILPRSSLSNA